MFSKPVFLRVCGLILSSELGVGGGTSTLRRLPACLRVFMHVFESGQEVPLLRQ